MQKLKIESFSNEKIKYIKKLFDSSFRKKEKKFLIEGYREIRKALESGKVRFDFIASSPECYLGENEEDLLIESNERVIEVPRRIFEKISYRDRPDGLLGVAYEFDLRLPKSPLPGLHIIIEGVEKPGNLGTILRTTEGAGVSSLILCDQKLDVFNPNVVRASTGTLFTIPVFTSGILEAFSFYKKFDFEIISVTPEANQNYFTARAKKNTVYVFGSEQYGLSKEAKSGSDLSVSIPMYGKADSLNLAMSVGIIMYDHRRRETES